MTKKEVHSLLEAKYQEYCVPDFIPQDPISIPHRFTQLQDVEITALWVSLLSWGQRKTIINKSNELFALMDNQPYEFILNHKEQDRERFAVFKHRTFQYTDTLYFLDYLQRYYQEHESLQTAFTKYLNGADHVGPAIAGFHEDFFAVDYAPHRTRKHVATPVRGSTCKRINMFLRWMVRTDKEGVDFALWKEIKSSQLLMPLDVHVDRVARQLGLIRRKQRDWKTVIELTAALKEIDNQDPVKFDFALFGMGVMS